MIVIDHFPCIVIDDDCEERIEHAEALAAIEAGESVIWCVEMDMRAEGDTRDTAIIATWNFNTEEDALDVFEHLRRCVL